MNLRALVAEAVGTFILLTFGFLGVATVSLLTQGQGDRLIATLVAVYPANIYMALNPSRFPSIPQWALIARLPLQFLFIYWVWLATLAEGEAPASRK